MVNRQNYSAATRRSVSHVPRILCSALAAFLALFIVGQLGVGSAYAQKTCKKEDKYGRCVVEEEDDGDDSKTPRPREPEEGATSTEKQLSVLCGAIPGEDGVYRCSDYDPCPEGDDYSHRAVRLRDLEYRDGSWQPTSDWYIANPPVQCVKADGEVTEAQVRREVVEFGMKVGDVQAAPPGGKTLVNFDTIVWTEQGAYEFDLEVLDTPIQLRANPAAYHWDFGDGNKDIFDTPGVAYAKGNPMDGYHTHAYEDTGNYDVTLTIEYQVEWNAGDGWQPITGTISSEPDEFALDVVEKRNRLRDGG